VHFVGLLRSEEFKQLLAHVKDEVSWSAARPLDESEEGRSWRRECPTPTPPTAAASSSAGEKTVQEEGWNADDGDDDCEEERERAGLAPSKRAGSPDPEDATGEETTFVHPGDRKRGAKRQAAAASSNTRRSAQQMLPRSEDAAGLAASHPQT
jgi:hypothetical protein